MNVHDTLFFVFSVAMLLCGVLVIVNRSPVTSAMFLVLLFVCMAGLFVLLEAFFLAAIQVLVYAGAVMVLFLFVIMLLDIKASTKRGIRKAVVAGGFGIAGIFAWETWVVLQQPVASLQTGPADVGGSFEQVLAPLFRNYMLPFEITGLVLLVAMIGVVLLSKKDLR